MHKHPSKHHYGKWIALVIMICAFGTLAYFVHLGNSDSWPETDCAVVGNRVVRDDVRYANGSGFVMYKGQYQLRYSVSGRDYFVWANAGWSDPEKQFVQNKVDYLPEHCDFRVRYNPLHPGVAVAIHKVN